jgi:hypothetical protein
MIRASSLFILTLFFLFFSSCGPSDKTDYPALIDETCRCLQPMVEFNNRSQEAIAARDSARLAILAREFTQLQESTQSCTETVDEKFGSLSPEQEGKAISLLEKTCPDVAELMIGAQE